MIRKWRDLIDNQCSYYTLPLPEWYISHQISAFVTINEPIWTHYYHSESVIYIRYCSWCCIFSGFGLMYNDMYLSLLQHKELFQCPKNPLCSMNSSLSPYSNPWKALVFLLSLSLCLFQNVIQLESYKISKIKLFWF